MSNEETVWWDEWNTKYRIDQPDAVFAALGDGILREVTSLRLIKPRVLEVGCGTGWLASRLPGDFSYLGLDLSPEAIRVAQRQAEGRRFLAADFHDWNSRSERFDLAVMVDTIAYFRRQDLAIAKLAQLLEPGGTVVLSTVNPWVYSRMSWIGPPGKGQVRRWLTPKALETLLRQADFSVAKHYTAVPGGDRGVLRVLNSRRLNRLAEHVIPAEMIRRMKERMGLGQFQVAVALLSR